MMKLNSNKGITLAVLIVVIVVVVILLGVSIDMGVDSINDSTDEQFKSELYIVQQAIYQKQIEYDEKGISAEIIGEKIVKENKEGEAYKTIDEYPKFKDAYEKINGKEIDIINTSYYILQNGELENLGLSGKRVEESEFIVNYETGEVYNNTKKYYSNGITPMYLPGYNIDEKTGNFKSDVIEIVEDTSN